MSNFLEGHLHIKRHEVAFLLYIAPRNSLILRKTVNVHGNVCQRVDNGLSLFNACHYLLLDENVEMNFDKSWEGWKVKLTMTPIFTHDLKSS